MSTPTPSATSQPSVETPAAATTPASAAPAQPAEAPAQAELKLPPPLVASEGAAPTKEAGEAAASENDFTEWPEGLDGAAKASLDEFRKELKLDATGTKKMIERWQKAQEQAAEQAEKAFVQQANEFTKQAADHPTVKQLGGIDKARTLASAALAKHGNQGLNDVLAKTGMAYHPDVLAFFASVGARLSEDSVAGATSASRPAPTEAQRLRAIYSHPTSASMFKE